MFAFFILYIFICSIRMKMDWPLFDSLGISCDFYERTNKIAFAENLSLHLSTYR